MMFGITSLVHTHSRHEIYIKFCHFVLATRRGQASWAMHAWPPFEVARAAGEAPGAAMTRTC
jgi:hypothetical protein